MTEEEYLGCNDPRRILESFGRDLSSQGLCLALSSRRLRLLVCAICRQLLAGTSKALIHRAIEVAERLADGMADDRERVTSRLAIIRSRSRIHSTLPTRECSLALSDHDEIDWQVINALSRKDHQKPRQCEFLRDILGNPFRPSTVAPNWLTWNNRTVPKLAQTIYDDRRYDIMPILADALEEAGCTDAAILDHCRGPGPHVRGCWVVDLILGKE
jgi:hypothetical protein